MSQRIRKRIEEAFGWIKTIADQERTKFRGGERVGWAFTFAAAALQSWRGCQSSWMHRREGPSQLPTDRPLADRRGGSLGQISPRYLHGPATLRRLPPEAAKSLFGALEGGLEVEYARDSIGFHWAGCEEGDEVEGEGTAELLDDGTIEIEFAYRNGDEAVLKAKRMTSSGNSLLGRGFVG